jgi:hypothetical protein
MEASTKFRTVKEKLVRCLNNERLKAGTESKLLTADNFRLWKSDFSYNTRDKM